MPVVVDFPLVPATPIASGAALNNCASKFGPRHHARTRPPRRDDVGDCRLDRRRRDHDLIRASDTAAVLCIELNAACAQEGEFRRRPPLVERTVGAFDLKTLVAQDQCQRQHAAPADAAEEITLFVIHRRNL